MSSPRLSVAVCICAHLSMETYGHHNNISDHQPDRHTRAAYYSFNPKELADPRYL